ncbi:MAG: CYTH domain-containing protein [Bacteroidetes bacterium]|nr:CYTH domain-containing protein [Bacteroidota bacterium]
MALEIERKFFVNSLPKGIEQFPFSTLEQGYIAIDSTGTEVRLRKKDDQYTLTIKSEGGLSRKEMETPIFKEQFQILWPATEGKRLRKDRYLLKQEKHTIEVDIYHLNLKGLMIAEVEFSSEEEANSYTKEAWMGEEVTGLSIFKNKNLFSVKTFDDLKLKWKKEETD